MKKISQDYVTLSPAYGRDFSRKSDVEASFLEGKDFRMESIGFGGGYCSLRDFASGTKVTLRYGNKQKSTIVTVP